jgi:hypothetical protein
MTRQVSALWGWPWASSVVCFPSRIDLNAGQVSEYRLGIVGCTTDTTAAPKVFAPPSRLFGLTLVWNQRLVMVECSASSSIGITHYRPCSDNSTCADGVCLDSISV